MLSSISKKEVIIYNENLWNITKIEQLFGNAVWDKWEGQAIIHDLLNGEVWRMSLHWYQDRQNENNQRGLKLHERLERLDETLYLKYTKPDINDDFTDIFKDE